MYLIKNPPDTPELEAGCDILREIYWREYGRGWREALESIKRILEQPAPSPNEATVEQTQEGNVDG